MFSWLRGRRWPWVVLGGALVVAGVLAALVVFGREGDVSNPNVEFETQTAPPKAPLADVPPKGKHPFDDHFTWPVYGYDKARTKYLPTSIALRPPFVKRWGVTGRILLEFTPVLCRRSAFLLKNNGALYSVSRQTGRVNWKRKLGYLAAASPACGHGTVYVVLLARGKNVRSGRVMALSTKDGHTRWSRKLPSRAESSPMLDHGRLYFGTEDGTVYALRAHDGAVRWRFKANGAVKGGLALDKGKLYFGTYGGRVYAIRRRDGGKVWQKSPASGGALGVGGGNFYGTPAVAYGRVYIGSTNGFVYSLAARNGALAWRHKTGNYVYSSPAVAPVMGGTVYVGSYDGKLYAFNARTGSVRWTRDSGGKLSGGPAVIGNLVFYSNYSRKSTAAVGAASGKLIWSINRGAFNPAISDGRRIYLNGYSSLFMFTTRRQARLDNKRRVQYRLAEQARSRARGGKPTTRAERRAAARRRARNHRRAVAIRRHRRYILQRVAQRKRLVHEILARRKAGRKVCFPSKGRKVCRIPRPPVCFKRPDGRTVCRSRKP